MEGEKSLKVYLAFRRIPSESIFFNGQVGFYGARFEGVCYLLSKSSILLLHPEFLAMVSTHFVTPTAVLKLNSFFLISTDEKGATSVFRVLANQSASFFFLYPVRWFIRTTISIQYNPLLYPSGHRMQTSVGFHSDPDLLLLPRGIDLHSLFLF